MTILEFHIRVKFRAFGITFGTSEWRPVLPLPVALPSPLPLTTLVNDRGVLVTVTGRQVGVGIKS